MKEWIRFHEDRLNTIAVVILFSGFFLTPIYLRQPILSQWIGYYGHANLLMTLGLFLMLLTKRGWSRAERIIACVYLLLFIPGIISDARNHTPKELAIVMFFNNWLPLLLPFCRLGEKSRRRLIRGFLIALDAFTLFLLLLAVLERVTGGSLLKRVIDLYKSWGLETTRLGVYDFLQAKGSHRFQSVWGHTLTNAAIFNLSFILNDIYHRCTGTRYPRFVSFGLALVGTLLCVGKTAVVVLLLYFVLSSWGRWMDYLLYAALLAAAYFTGLIKPFLRRLFTTSLTSGRSRAMRVFLAKGDYPFHFFYGYGSGSVTRIDGLAEYASAFEYTPFMIAINYGMLASLMQFGAMAYYLVSEFVKKRRFICLFGIGLWVVQVNTYYYAAYGFHDVCWLEALAMMIAINCIALPVSHETAPRAKEE